MDRLIETLRPFHQPADLMGAEPIDRAALRTALAELEARLGRLYWIRVAMIGAIFLVEIAIALAYHDDASVLAGVAGALGITVAGAVKAMADVSSDMAETGLVLILAGQLDAETMSHIVRTLVSRSAAVRSSGRATSGRGVSPRSSEPGR
jgi:hypothetical protein